MRQTRRSRSAATPQKDEAAMKEESVGDTPAKANLETVFEREGNKEEVGASVEEMNAERSANEDEGMEEKGESRGESVEDAASSSQQNVTDESGQAASPKKPDNVIELNCQVCNCSFTNFHEHMNSDAHKSKISHSSPKTEVPSNNDKASPATPAQKRSGDPIVTPSPKRMRNQNQNAQNTSGTKFHCEVCNLTIFKQQDFDHHLNGKKHMLNVTRAEGRAYCDVCKLFFITITDLNDHTESQLHKKNLAEKKQDKTVHECKICNWKAVGQMQYDQHLLSKRHKKALERPAGSTPNAGGTPNAASTPSAESVAVNGKPEQKADATQKKWLYYCNACNFGCSQDQEFSSHMILAEHKAAVTDMRKKGHVLEKGAAKSGNRPFGNKPAAVNKPVAPNKPGAQKPGGAANAPQNVRKFTPNNVVGGPRNVAGPQGAGPKTAGPGPVTKVTYNIVSGPSGNLTGPAKAAVTKKGPAGAPIGPKKNLPPNKTGMATNKPPLSGRPNQRFQGQGNDMQHNKAMGNAQPMKLAFQKVPFDGPGNFGGSFGNVPEPVNAGANFGNFGGRSMGSYGNVGMNMGPDVRGDFRGNMRDDFRPDVREIRDLRDIRNVDLGPDSRGDAFFRSGYSRDMPGDTGRDIRDYGGNFRGPEVPLDVRSEGRPGIGADTRGDMRSLARSDMGREMAVDARGYGSSDIRDARSDSLYNRSSMSGGYSQPSAYSQQGYRGNDYRSESYARGQSGAQTSSSGSYSGGMMAGGRYEYLERNTTTFSNQFGGSSRGMGYMSDMALNGR